MLVLSVVEELLPLDAERHLEMEVTVALIAEARKSFGADSRIVRRLEDDLETVDPSRDRRPFQADRYRAERERRRAERESYGY